MKNKAIKIGIISGIVILAINTILYLYQPRTMLTFGGYAGWIVHIGFMYWANKQYRESLGGVMNIKEGFKNAWQVFATASIMEGIFAYILFNYVDGSMYEITRTMSIERAAQMCELSGISPCLELQNAEKITVEDLKLTVGTMLYSIAYRMITPGAVLALIVAGVTRREAI